MSILRKRNFGRRLGFESLEAREYMSADGLPLPAPSIVIGPIREISAAELRSAKDYLVFGESIADSSRIASQYEAQEVRELLRDVDDTYIADFHTARVQLLVDNYATMPVSITASLPNINGTLSIAIEERLEPDDDDNYVHKGPNGGLGPNTFISETQFRANEAREYRPQPASFWLLTAPAVVSSASVNKAEILPASLRSQTYEHTPAGVASIPAEYEVEVIEDRLSEPTNVQQPQSEQLSKSLEGDASMAQGLRDLDDLINALSRANVNLRTENRHVESKYESRERTTQDELSSDYRVSSGDGFIAISTRQDGLATISHSAIKEHTHSETWTQRVAMSQSIQGLRAATPRYQARAELTNQSDSTGEEPEESNQYWTIVPVALSIVAFDWCRRHIQRRLQKRSAAFVTSQSPSTDA